MRTPPPFVVLVWESTLQPVNPSLISRSPVPCVPKLTCLPLRRVLSLCPRPDLYDGKGVSFSVTPIKLTARWSLYQPDRVLLPANAFFSLADAVTALKGFDTLTGEWGMGRRGCGVVLGCSWSNEWGRRVCWRLEVKGMLLSRTNPGLEAGFEAMQLDPMVLRKNTGSWLSTDLLMPFLTSCCPSFCHRSGERQQPGRQNHIGGFGGP